MKNGGTGIGSASILLIFTVLCLSVFAVISLSTSRTDKAITDNWEKTVREYYEADLLAEEIIADIIELDFVPDTLRGIAVSTEYDEQAGSKLITYNCPISDNKELCVKVLVRTESYDILEWRVLNTGVWETEGAPVIWPGA